MFGHQDNDLTDAQNHASAEPAADGALDGNAAAEAEDNRPAVRHDHEEGAPEANEPARPDTNQLLDIKRQALTQLTPLVDHLDQSPEEKFKTTMMMIQASDNQSLISVAYDAAKQISNEKARAQALLDIVNEINYFTGAQKLKD